MFINQLTLKHGSMVKGYAPIRDYYKYVLDMIGVGLTEENIEAALRVHETYQSLVKERPIPTKKAKAFTQNAKNVMLLNGVLENAFVCNICRARIDKKAMQLDHVVDKSAGGTADIDNGQWSHPYCNSTYKYALERERHGDKSLSKGG
jgi:hypothetical protein